MHSLLGVEVVRHHSPSLEVNLDAGIFEDPGDLDVRLASLLVFLYDNLLFRTIVPSPSIGHIVRINLKIPTK